MPGAALSVAIGRDFLVPQDSRLDDYDLLRKAVDIAKDPEYREKRKAFNDWRRDFLNSEGEIDVSSLENAKDELETLVHQERELLERRKGWTVAKHILFVVQVAGMLAPSIAIASEAFGVSSQPLAFSSAQAFVAAGSFAVTNK